MTGWPLAVVLVGIGTAGGWVVCSWLAADKIEHLQGVVVALKAAQQHEPCMEIIGRLWAEAEETRAYADSLERERER